MSSFRYEGTGRSLSLKLIQQLREQSTTLGSASKGSSTVSLGRSLQEITLNESIRYAPGDEVERWLHHLLCLDATVVQKLTSGCPLPENCDLYPLPLIVGSAIFTIIKIKLHNTNMDKKEGLVKQLLLLIFWRKIQQPTNQQIA